MTTVSPFATTAPDATVSFRLGAMDSAKGIGIVLVVFGHAWRGAMGAQVLPEGPLFRLVDYAVYAFHMPLFFLLSGLLFLQTVWKYDTGTLLRGRVTRLLWPMALWTWVFFSLKLVAGDEANAPVTMADAPLIPLPPYEHLWFLWALFLCQSLLVVIFASPISRLSEGTLRWGAGACGLLLALLNPYVSVPSLIWGPMVEHFPYFLAGIAVGGLAIGRPPLLVSVLFALAFFALLASVGQQKASVLVSFGLVVFAWFAWLGIDRNSPTVGPVLQGLRYLGQASMVIYLTHTAFSAALRIAMLKSGIDTAAPVVLVTTLIGVFAPLPVLWFARRAGLTKLLGF